MDNVLIVEDDSDIQTQMKWGLSKDFQVHQATNRIDAMKIFDAVMPMVVTLDLGLPPDEDGSTEGLACLHEILKKAPRTKVIMVTGNEDRDNALKAVQMGAYDFYHKPIDMKELKIIIQRAFHLSQLEGENLQLHMLLNKEAGFVGMLGQCSEMNSIFETIQKVATTDATVMVTGESGTGKELVARAVHEKSGRNSGPFIAINCGAIPEELLESELFGHEKGAFTNAFAQQKGKFEYAEKGTLFLDEIGEMSTRLQAKLLRFLQERTMQRVGGRKDIEIDTRVIAATNIDLEAAMKDGSFREDLYYRISVISINIPPLRDRGADITLLASVFLDKYTAMFNKKIKGFSPEALEALGNYTWPGNVRELENKLQKAVITADGVIIQPEDMGLDKESRANFSNDRLKDRYAGITLKEARKRLEMDLIGGVVERHRGNIKRAAEELGVSRPTLYDLIDKYDLSTKESDT
ncbi:MAG: PEP-CTERM-box response regulator transcription factor [Nitrospira sp.]|nr:PEP-CTERM-box response regulator transcription factor [Nitrospira sp.]